jgi:hypothetical protein
MEDRELIVEIVEKLPNELPYVCHREHKSSELYIKTGLCVIVVLEHRVLVGR